MAYHPDEISSETFHETLSRYKEHVDSGLEELDAQRYDAIGRSIRSRLPPSLEKDELLALVTWKMKHGTWRPNLAKLAESNADDSVENQSKLAMSHVPEKAPGGVAMKSALKSLTELRGVGPATASLILSCYRPDSIPFFSDELFRWLHWDDPRKGKGTGWKAQIAYTVTEYVSLVEKAQALCGRLNDQATHDPPSMLELEKVAYVIGHEQIDVTRGPAKSSNQDSDETKREKSRESSYTNSGGELPTDDLAESTKLSPDNAVRKRARDSINTDVPISNRRSRRVKRRQA